ncbi:hypothetical protein N7499_003520 [Penicillium canescens]|uniref:Uncharacterized protein n=1 Tax=Penicillium canescens TaxID=5083 RepID=A0AAD6I9Z9_PENCN|nr:uncharacterized protein N7446_012446 [Penicillium canescens]KAJ6020230.1 hypothetical protein N7522_000305 [Penicillium canescens]KAJ6038184.1 hypothetical protein N7460_007955 [Penicillium canescens]KAJ6045582.1 hypothetical protein N7446_012446 [Penicillium canescens]KAJ6090806.1 hypothetical protein N7499_003520 [Penicillium canescens]KAJ6175001.1 hypothetical protein N7485_004806 [Penicillium canescens]
MENQSGKMVVTVCAGPFVREAVVNTVRPRTSEDLRLFSLYLEPSFEWLNELSTQAPECSGQTRAHEGHRDLSDCASVISGSTLTPESPKSEDEKRRNRKFTGDDAEYDETSDFASVLSGGTRTPESNDESWRKQRIAEGAPTGLRYTKGSKKSTGERYAV